VARRQRLETAYDEYTGGAAAPSASGPTRMDKSKPSKGGAFGRHAKWRTGKADTGFVGTGGKGTTSKAGADYVRKRNAPKYGQTPDESLAANKKVKTSAWFGQKSKFTKAKEYREKSPIGKLFGKLGTGGGGGKFSNIIKKATGGK